MQIVFQDSDASLNPRLPVAELDRLWPARPRHARAPKPRRSPMICCNGSGSIPTSLPRAIRMSCRAGKSSASTSPARLRSTRASHPRRGGVGARQIDRGAGAQSSAPTQGRRFNLTYVFISHDLNVVHYISDRVLVMYLGQVVEIGPIDAIYRDPKHPYTQALLESRLAARSARTRSKRPRLPAIRRIRSIRRSGCRFRTRCPFAEDICAAKSPPLARSESRRGASCRLPHGASKVWPQPRAGCTDVAGAHSRCSGGLANA